MGAKTGLSEQGAANPAANDIAAFAEENPDYVPSSYWLMTLAADGYLTAGQIEDYNTEKVSDMPFYVFGVTQEVVDPAALF